LVCGWLRAACEVTGHKFWIKWRVGHTSFQVLFSVDSSQMSLSVSSQSPSAFFGERLRGIVSTGVDSGSCLCQLISNKNFVKVT
jgi:hypothetical protein